MAGEKVNRKVSLCRGLVWGWSLLLLTACDQDVETKREQVDISKSDPRVILAPGKAGVLSGSTLLVPTVPGTLHVYSVPQFAGVENPGEIGIGTSAGYNPGERVLLPINVNLGTQTLGSYSLTLRVQDPAAIRIVDVDGSYASLPLNYPTQYQPAEGFENQPTVNLGDTITTITATASAPEPTTGRVNLANVTVDLLTPGPLPANGVFITFTLNSLQTPAKDDLCALLTAGPCRTFDGLVIENFKLH